MSTNRRVRWAVGFTYGTSIHNTIFADLPADYLAAGGGKLTLALPVPGGAHADMLRVANLIQRAGTDIGAISITVDSHHRIDIAHSVFWSSADSAEVTPFTQISAADVRTGKYQPRQPDALPWMLHYLDQLEADGRYRLMVWPVIAKSVSGATACMPTCDTPSYSPQERRRTTIHNGESRCVRKIMMDRFMLRQCGLHEEYK